MTRTVINLLEDLHTLEGLVLANHKELNAFPDILKETQKKVDDVCFYLEESNFGTH